MEIVVGKYEEKFCLNFLKGLFKCLVPFRTLTTIKLRIKTDKTFCKRDIDLIGINGVSLIIKNVLIFLIRIETLLKTFLVNSNINCSH